MCRHPGVETPGYYQLSLRDGTHLPLNGTGRVEGQMKVAKAKGRV
jgi:hypothetical protein